MNNLTDELIAIFPEAITRENLLLVNAKPLDKTTYYQLGSEGYTGIYEPCIECGKDKNGNYLNYSRRRIVDERGKTICC